ncbi:MAG TPA: GyrI-like domain-containing protein [Anaerolineales bacterium]|nr:GyrI-like domain-containing protein [Anaerolineales bacterium]
MLRIGEFSKIAQVSVKTLRYYDRYGLLKPAWIDRYNGYRYYHIEQLANLNRILALKELGFSLEQIQKILEDEPSGAELRRMMQLKQMELEKQIKQDTARLGQIEARLHRINQESSLPGQKMLTDVIVKEVPTRLVAGLRRTVFSYSLIPHLYTELCQAIPAASQQPDPTLPAATIHYDSEFIESGMNVEMVAPVTQKTNLASPLRVYWLEGAAQMACLIHQGSLEEIPQAFQRLMSWVEANSFRITGLNREVYLRGVAPTPKTETMPDGSTEEAKATITELQVPVERKPIPIFVQKFKEYPQMEPKIITKPDFTVIGMKYTGKNENGEIPKLWSVAAPRFTEIKNTIESPFVSYGICGNLYEDGRFDYLAGVSVDSTKDIPEGMESWEVKEQTYVVLPCTLTNIHKTYEYAHTEWIPNNNYERLAVPDFEFYDEGFDPTDPESLLYVYIPVRKKD